MNILEMFILFDDSEYSHEFQRKQDKLKKRRKSCFPHARRFMYALLGLYSCWEVSKVANVRQLELKTQIT